MSGVTHSNAMYQEASVTTMSVTSLQNAGDLGRRLVLKDHSLTVGAGAIKAHGTFKVFQLCKRDSSDGTTLAVGSVVYWMARTTAGNQFVFTGDESAGGRLGHVAGVALSANPAAGKYGWIQTFGLGPVHLVDSPTVAGSTAGLPIIGTTTDLKGDTVSTVTAAILGFCLSAKDASIGGGAIGTNLVLAHLCPPQVD